MLKRTWILALVVILAACGGESSATPVQDGSDRQYAEAMGQWWSKVTNDRVGDVGLIPYLALDSNAVSDADPLIPSSLPASLRQAHLALVESVRVWANNAEQVQYYGIEVGVAAAFCDPRDSHLPGLDWPTIERMQLWRQTGEVCRDADRWGGNWNPKRSAQGQDWGDYTWHCGSDPSEFRVGSIELRLSCDQKRSAENGVTAATAEWANALLRACGGTPAAFEVSVEEALRACSK